jgi:exocyst complex protein 7
MSRAFKRIMPYEDVFEELAASQDLPWETDDDRADDEESRVRIFAHHLFHCLLANLRQKADAYGKMDGADTLSGAGRPYLFLMNNAQYILKAIKGDDVKDAQQRSPTGAQIVSVLADAFVDRLAGLVNETREKYNKAVFVPLSEHTRQTDLPLEYSKGSSILTLDSGRQIKSRFTAFNAGLEEIYQHQKPYSVPDVALRQRLRQDGRSIVLSSYTEFFERFSQVHFSKKHMDQYLKFPPKTVGTMIDELYSG